MQIPYRYLTEHFLILFGPTTGDWTQGLCVELCTQHFLNFETGSYEVAKLPRLGLNFLFFCLSFPVLGLQTCDTTPNSSTENGLYTNKQQFSMIKSLQISNNYSLEATWIRWIWYVRLPVG